MTPILMSRERGRIRIELLACRLGEDLAVNISGGDSPHIGCVTLSINRPGISEPGTTGATTSVINVTGHKDDHVLSVLSSELSSVLNTRVSVTGGIHLDNITQGEIEETALLIKELKDELIGRLSQFHSQ